eukprot:TRINITY_DN9784_c0_g2_i2.p1 TRINITY_DN9784_c0_g2~~TRINITY_DN9784_c0_g2_i2.p1  ORF type:complete len:258 (-),score=41.31 TRINITY_DN9784_c0_g2_i2:2-775(-)
MGGGFNLLTTSNAVTFQDIFFNIFSGSMIECYAANLVWVSRAVGYGARAGSSNNRAVTTSAGIRFLGNSHNIMIDSISLQYVENGIVTEATAGVSNVRILISNSNFVVNGRALLLLDATFVTMTGCSIEFSDIDGVYMGSGNSRFHMQGGSIVRSGGASGCTNPTTSCNGLLATSGSFNLNQVFFGHNEGRAVHVTSSSVINFSINGNTFISNRMAMNLTDGSQYIVNGNLCASNIQPANIYTGSGGTVSMNTNCVI